ncbi:hypothetical protein HMPREF9602_01994 [Cutibacterium acnes HL030PA2]|nr:hypothetical protein HMPREF9602_01994 [Cutibacterium acnes HL030PA2]
MGGSFDHAYRSQYRAEPQLCWIISDFVMASHHRSTSPAGPAGLLASAYSRSTQTSSSRYARYEQ